MQVPLGIAKLRNPYIFKEGGVKVVLFESISNSPILEL